jgi:hypothetical protein
MKRGYKVSIGGSFFAGSGGSAQMGQQDGTGNQRDDPETDNDKEGAQLEQNQDAQPQQQKHPRMLTNLASTRDQGQRKRDRQTEPTQQTTDGRQMREEEGQDCAIGHATQGKTTKIDGNHKGRDVCRRTGIYIIERNNTHIIPSIITGNITNHVKSNVTITNEENQPARESRQKPARHQRMHATNRRSLDSSNIGVIQKYEARQEILVADGPQENTSDDNTYGKEQEGGEVHVEETRNNTAWDNQLKGCMTIATRRIRGNRKRKTTGKQLITYFWSTLVAPGNQELDTDAHLDKYTIIFTIKKLQDKTKEEVGKEDSIVEDHSKHLCKQQRIEQERMKNIIKQNTTAFLTTIIITLIKLNT